MACSPFGSVSALPLGEKRLRLCLFFFSSSFFTISHFLGLSFAPLLMPVFCSSFSIAGTSDVHGWGAVLFLLVLVPDHVLVGYDLYSLQSSTFLHWTLLISSPFVHLDCAANLSGCIMIRGVFNFDMLFPCAEKTSNIWSLFSLASFFLGLLLVLLLIAGAKVRQTSMHCPR